MFAKKAILLSSLSSMWTRTERSVCLAELLNFLKRKLLPPSKKPRHLPGAVVGVEAAVVVTVEVAEAEVGTVEVEAASALVLEAR